MIIDGRTLAKRMRADIAREVLALGRAPSFLALAVAPSPATQSYLKMKRRLAEEAGIRMEVRSFSEATTEEIIEALRAAREDAVIVQLPLPDALDTKEVLKNIPPEKDADVLSPRTRAEGGLMHPVAAAVKRILLEANVAVAGKRAVVVGAGWLVGEPVRAWLLSAGASVAVVTREAGALGAAFLGADIIVSGAGVAGLIKKNMVPPGAVVIDIGTSELGGSILGDAEPSVGEIASVFTPVPGGVGPVTVACLLQNVVTLAKARAF